MPKQPRELAQHDWDFSECPAEEHETCRRYEYCRESKIADAVETFRRNRNKFESLWEKYRKIHGEMAKAIEALGDYPNKSEPDRKEIDENLSTLSHVESMLRPAASFVPMLFFNWFAPISDFPRRPWLDLDRRERRIYQAVIKEHGDDLCALMGLEIVEIRDGVTLDFANLARTCGTLRPDSVIGGFNISPGYTKEEILRVFERFLDRTSAEHPKLFVSKKGGRGGPADELRQLAAFRLLRERSPARAYGFVQRHTNSKGNGIILYENKASSWYRARDAAKQRLTAFDEIGHDLCGIFKHLK